MPRMPRAYNRPASSATCASPARGGWPCPCSPVAVILHSTGPSAASPGNAAVTWCIDSTTAWCVGGYSRASRKVVAMAPSARSSPAVSIARALPLDPVPPVLVVEHPGSEAGRRDRFVRADARPVVVAARVGRDEAAPLRLRHHFLRPLDPDAELLGPQVHPAARRRAQRIGRLARHDHDAAAVQALAIRRQDGVAHGHYMTPQRAVLLHKRVGLDGEPLRL